MKQVIFAILFIKNYTLPFEYFIMSQKILLQITNFETNDIIEDVNVDAVKCTNMSVISVLR